MARLPPATATEIRGHRRFGTPTRLWATDATEAWSGEGRAAVFCVVDHASGEAWADAALRMDRFAAADLLREVCSERFGSLERAVASGLALRYDGGPCFRSEHYQAEIDHLGIARSPAYQYEPETNGCVERFIQTLKEQLLWIERFDSFEQLRRAVRAFARLYNREWLLERHGYLTPIEARERLLAAENGQPITGSEASEGLRSPPTGSTRGRSGSLEQQSAGSDSNGDVAGAAAGPQRPADGRSALQPALT